MYKRWWEYERGSKQDVDDGGVLNVFVGFLFVQQGAEDGSYEALNSLVRLPRHHPLIKDSISDEGEEFHATLVIPV